MIHAIIIIIIKMTLQAVQTFEKMVPLLEKQGAAIVKQVGCVYHFELRAKKDDQA